MKHVVYFENAQDMNKIKDESIDFVVTSPPYPMIKMWDNIMSELNPSIKEALDSNDSHKAFELMHQELDKVWTECYRVMKEGSFMCINIGDATRTLGGQFMLYNNNARIIQACEKIGFTTLPNIIWHKQTNAPNKFMGSGMLPCGAYVTLEHEYILIFRKGEKRIYKGHEKDIRRNSAFFWEERNIWFSDIWNIKGTKQTIDNALTRDRNASFPLEIPYRLINMYSQKGDVVLDPFYGLGTTSLAAILAERNSVGYEIDSYLRLLIEGTFRTIDVTKLNDLIEERYKKHLSFIEKRIKEGKEVRYDNPYMHCKVMTRQETNLYFHYLKDVKIIDNPSKLIIESTYHEI